MVGYVLIEWDVDKSLSIVPISRLQSRKGSRVTQKWGAKVYAGVILEEGGENNNTAVSCLLQEGFLQFRIFYSVFSLHSTQSEGAARFLRSKPCKAGMFTTSVKRATPFLCVRASLICNAMEYILCTGYALSWDKTSWNV